MTKTPRSTEHYSFRKAPVIAASVWMALAIVGHSLLSFYNDDTNERAERQWEERLSMVASHQAAQLGALVESRRHVVKGIAENVSAQLYLTVAEEDDSAESELTFLRNYVVAMAEQAGLGSGSPEAEQIEANVKLDAAGGLAILNAQAQPVVATRHFPGGALPQDMVTRATPEGTVWGPDAQERVWVYAPIASVQSEEPVGYAVAAFRPAATLANLLAKGELPGSPADSLVIEERDGALTQIAPKVEAPVQFNDTALAEAFAKPGTTTKGRNVKGEPAIVMAIAVEGTPWRVVRQITVAEAMKEAHGQAASLLLAYWLAVIAITFTAVALWRHLTAERLATMVRHIRQHEQLLELISEHMPARLLILDETQRVRYANRQAAQKAGLPRADVAGKTLAQLMGPIAAKPFADANERALSRKTTELTHLEQSGAAGLELALEVYHVPLPGLPEMLVAETQGGVMMIEQDLTETLRAKYAQQHLLASLIETIVSLADMRDPHASQHSSGVVFIGRAIADTMHAEADTITTLSTAGQLMNLGKLFVPQHVLTASGAIPADERQQMVQAMQRTIEHLSHVPFDGPVIETLRQTQERVDGSGPLGLKEDSLLPSAKILSVANSFVALASPRAYRERLEVARALDVLQQSAGTLYSATVITALRHYLENLGGEKAWHAFAARESNAA